jgi:hypothetical protein
MDLRNLLSEKRPAILKRWFDAVLETYPADTSNFLKKQKNQFTNPVGHTIYQGMEHILEELLRGTDLDKLVPSLDNIVRIRAVQDLTPSQAVSFILFLKKIIREELGNNVREHSACGDILGLEDRIDTLALMSFDIYISCREKIYELKANETKRLTYRLLQRANLVCEMPDE